MSKDIADDIAGHLWDVYKNTMREWRDEGRITRDEYTMLIDLINDYGYASKVAGIHGQNTHQTEEIYYHIMRRR